MLLVTSSSGVGQQFDVWLSRASFNGWFAFTILLPVVLCAQCGCTGTLMMYTAAAGTQVGTRL
jgi:hypothetical protein